MTIEELDKMIKQYQAQEKVQTNYNNGMHPNPNKIRRRGGGFPCFPDY